MKVIVFAFLLIQECYATLSVPNLPNEGTLSADTNHYMDKNVNYQRFMGRVTDKSDDGTILKVQVENNNTKFYKVGDELLFEVNNHPSDTKCRATVRASENFYFTIRVENLARCWDKKKYFPRGMQLTFNSPKLVDRVFEASKFREDLIIKKEDFLKQLNGINHFLWSFEQQKVKVAADYDARIVEMEKQKRLALDDLIQQKKDNLQLQIELQKRLNEIDDSLKFYRIERQEYMTDRWNLDHDNDLPVGQRPQKMR